MPTPAGTDIAHLGTMVGLDREQLIRAFRIMHMARRLDDREVTSSGRTASTSRSAGRDTRRCRWPRAWRCGPATTGSIPYYRDRALCLTLGVTPHEMLQQAVGAADDPASGGRQMPSHWGHRSSTS